MKSLTFVLISIFSGAIVGVILAAMNLIFVEPFIDKAIGIETANVIASADNVDMDGQDSFRVWQKAGSVIAGSILGMAFGSLLGMVYATVNQETPNGVASSVYSSNDEGKTWLLEGTNQQQKTNV